MSPLIQSEGEIKVSRKTVRRFFWGAVLLLVLIGLVCAIFEVGVDKTKLKRPAPAATTAGR